MGSELMLQKVQSLSEFRHKQLVIGARELSEDEIAELVQLIIGSLRSDKVQIRQYTASTRINNEMTDRYRFDLPTLKELFTTWNDSPFLLALSTTCDRSTVPSFLSAIVGGCYIHRNSL